MKERLGHFLEAATEAEVMEECSPPHGFLSLLYSIARDHLLRRRTAISGPGPPHINR